MPLKHTFKMIQKIKTMKKKKATTKIKTMMIVNKYKLFKSQRKRLKQNPKNKLKSLNASNNDCQDFMKFDLLS